MRFIKYIPDSEMSEFLESKPLTNHLAMIIAKRARRTKCDIKKLDAGECFLGDFKEFGLTEQQYRTAKKHLENIKFATFRTTAIVTAGVTKRVTVAKLVNNEVWDINGNDSNGTDNGTSNGTNNATLTINKNDKNINDDKGDFSEEKNEVDLEQFDTRINKQLPFGLVDASRTLKAVNKDYLSLKAQVLEVHQIEATDEQLATAMKTFCQEGLSNYETYKYIKTVDELVKKLISWIPKSIKFEEEKAKKAAREKKNKAYQVEDFSFDGYLEYLAKVHSNRPDRIKAYNILPKKDQDKKDFDIFIPKCVELANEYKANATITPYVIFDIFINPYGEFLGGWKLESKAMAFKAFMRKLSDYNKTKGDIRKLVLEAYEKQRLPY